MFGTRAARLAGGWRAALAAGLRRPRLRLLLLSDGREYTSEQQFAPIWRHRTRLRRELGLAVEWMRLETALARPASLRAGWDMVGLKLSFRHSPGDALRIARGVAEGLDGTGARLVYFDGDDDSAVQWPALLDLCDLYVKKHRFIDAAAYARRFIGRNNLTDFVARTSGRSFAADPVPESEVVDPAALEKLHCGWNIALDDKIAALPPHPPEGERTIDICGRVHVAPESWLRGLRAPAIAALEALPADWTVAVPQGRVPQQAYYEEMRAARICVSPFGYGEICWRDFEAILCGCLLVKPDMSHIRTAPDLFVAGETYVPVAWDYSDLEAACAPYLADEGARLAIARRAQRRLIDSLSAGWFTARMADLFAAARRG